MKDNKIHSTTDERSVLSSNIQNIFQETDHYFQAELGHDQRVSWLLALSSGILFALGSYLIVIKKGEIEGAALPWLISAEFFTLASIVVFVLSLWPFAGKLGIFWKPWYRHKYSEKYQIEHFSDEWVLQHFNAHKYRAEKKASRLVWGILFLLVGLICSAIGLLVGCL